MWTILARCLLLSVVLAATTVGQSSLNYHGSIKSRVPVWLWFEAPPANDDYVFSGNLFRFGVGQERARFDWFAELAVPVLLGLPDDAIAPAPQGLLGLGANYYVANERSRNAINAFPKQAYVRVKKVFSPKDTLTLGRFEFDGGEELIPQNDTLAWLNRHRIAQRLIGNFGWSYVGRSWDGADYSWSRKDERNFTAMGALPTRGVFQVNGWRNLDVALGYVALSGIVHGSSNAGKWRVFGIYYDDWRHVIKTDNRPEALRATDFESIRLGTFGADYIDAFETGVGTFDGLVWAVGQVGAWGELTQRSGAIALEGGWQPPVLESVKPWLRAGYFYSTGDDDPFDDIHGTFFQILPTPRIYARFPFFNLMNLRDEFVMLILRPGSDWVIRADAHDLALANRHDLWYAGGGAFQPQTFGYAGRPSGGYRGLANLYDISVDYHVSSKLTLIGYFGYAVGQQVIRNIYPEGKNAALTYGEIDYTF